MALSGLFTEAPRSVLCSAIRPASSSGQQHVFPKCVYSLEVSLVEAMWKFPPPNSRQSISTASSFSYYFSMCLHRYIHIHIYAHPSLRSGNVASLWGSRLFFCRFVLCAEGKRAAEKKTKEQFQRPSVESTVETFLIDVDFPPDPLKKKAMGQTQLTGSVKFFVDLTHNGACKSIWL